MAFQKADALGRFVKGMTPWNKGKRGYMGANRTSFTRERADAIGKRSIGVGRVNNGWSMCLVDEREQKKDPRHKEKTYLFRKRMGTARYVLMKNGIDIPNGHVVWHLDGDPGNNEIENLEVISRAESIRRNNLRRRGGS